MLGIGDVSHMMCKTRVKDFYSNSLTFLDYKTSISLNLDMPLHFTTYFITILSLPSFKKEKETPVIPEGGDTLLLCEFAYIQNLIHSYIHSSHNLMSIHDHIALIHTCTHHVTLFDHEICTKESGLGVQFNIGEHMCINKTKQKKKQREKDKRAIGLHY